MGSNLINLMDLLIESSKSKSGGESGRINCKISITFQENTSVYMNGNIIHIYIKSKVLR